MLARWDYAVTSNDNFQCDILLPLGLNREKSPTSSGLFKTAPRGLFKPVKTTKGKGTADYLWYFEFSQRNYLL